MIAKTETLGGCKILRVSGRIDFESALDFEQQINAMIQEAGDGYIIELSQVELLSSAGLRVMLSTAKRGAHRNRFWHWLHQARLCVKFLRFLISICCSRSFR